jgi:hypothetical protein
MSVTQQQHGHAAHRTMAIVWGTGDIFFDEQWSHWLADTIPGTRSRMSLEGARLLFSEERPQ